MDLEQLKRQWVKPQGQSGALQAKIWDGRAEEFGRKEIPALDNNPFLKYLMEKAKPDAGMTALDIGCGTGRYTIAVAELVKRAVGIDVSPEMIRIAKQMAEERGLSNTEFYDTDWDGWNPGETQVNDKYDIVFAHMTPAICDYETMDKMNACAAGHCFLVKPARRRDSVQDAAFAQAGITEQRRQFDDTVSNAFTYLWEKGYCPELSYRNEVWEKEMPTGEMIDWCVNRARLQRTLTEEEAKKIAGYIQGISKNGKVRENTQTTIVTIYWKVQENR